MNLTDFIYSLFTVEQGLLFFGSLLSLIAIQIDSKRIILASMIAQSFLFGIAFYMMGLYTPVMISCLCVIAIIAVYFFEKYDKRLPLYFGVAFVLIAGGLNFFTMTTPWDIIFFIQPIFFMGVLRSSSNRNVRFFSLASRLILMLYNFGVGAYALEILGIPQAISNIIAIYRYDIRHKEEPDTEHSDIVDKLEDSNCEGVKL